MSTFRATKAGQLLKSDQFPRMALVGERGMELEVAHTKEGSRPGYHGVITVLGGSEMAAAGFYPRHLRAAAQAMIETADLIERVHGPDLGTDAVEL